MPAILVKLFFATTLALGLPSHHAFYFPGVQPQSFAQGEGVSLQVNKLTSSKTLLPIDYYAMPFCQPENGPLIYSQSLGQLLVGDRIQSSPYELRMMEDVFCQQLCVADLGEQGSNKLSQAIRNDYHHNWIVDNLPSASKLSGSYGIIHLGWKGFPVGYERGGIAKIYNHVNIEVMYHPVDDQPDKYRIVRFTVEPFSIRHDFNNTPVMDNDDDMDQIGSGGRSSKRYSINDPIPSCDPSIPLSDRRHTNSFMSKGKEIIPQDAHGQVLFTYDVIWIRRDDLHWASRWEVYMNMDHLIPPFLHWYSICNSLVVVLMLSALLASMACNSLRKKSNPKGKGNPKIQKWKLLHADVFRPPTFSPLLLSVACGTGAQLLCTAFWFIVLSAMGFLNPSRRGSFLTAILVLYALMGTISGYVTVHFFKIFQGKLWYRAALCSALAFPGLCFVMFLVIISTASSYGSTYAIPLATVQVLLLLWLLVLTPLVFLGGYMGYQQSTLKFPVKTSRTPRKIPNHPCYISLLYASLNFFAGIMPFGAIFVEYYCILCALWRGDYYYEFSFLFLVFVLMAIICAGSALITTFLRLRTENYHWWWYSFLSAGSTGIWGFLYSIFYFQRLDTISLGSYIIYFGYMGMISISTFLMTGFVGMFASLMINIALYGTIAKDVDETKSLFTEEMTAQETDTQKLSA